MIKIASFLTIALGATVATWSVARAAGAHPPPLPLTVALVLAGALAIALGVGIGRRSRVAWAFMLALSGVAAVVLLMALPGMMRAGFSSVAAGAVMGAVAIVFTLLVVLGEKIDA